MNAAEVLREWGFTLNVVDGDRITIEPFSKLDEELKLWIIENKQALIKDIHVADAVEKTGESEYR